VAVHQLAIFWRDLETRCFTRIHFLPAPKERAQRRANKILEVLDALSSLRIYGAVLDDAALPINLSKPIPETGTEKRLEVDLLPDAPLNPRDGVTKIKFSLPGPTQALYQTIDNNSLSETSDWLSLEKEVLPFLCLPSGIKVSSSPDRITRCQIRLLDPKRRPSPGRAPVEAAIAAAEQALAQQSSRQLSPPDQTDLDRVSKYSNKLAHLQSLQEMEQNFWLASQPSPALPKQSIAPPLLLQPPLFEEKQPMPDNTDLDNLYLPKLPTQPDAQWQDVAVEHFSDPAIWLNRNQLKQLYGLNERSYFRWLSRLEAAGLSRSLPSQQDDRVKLFYKPDLDMALAALSTKKRGRPTRSAARTVTPGDEASPSRASDGSSMPQTSVEGSLAQIASLAAQQLSLQQQQASLESSIKRIDDSLSKLTIERLPQLQDQITGLHQQLASQTNQASALSPMTSIVELLTQLTAFNQISHQIADLSKQLKRLPARLDLTASKTKASRKKVEPKAKARIKIGAAKKTAKAKLKAKLGKSQAKTRPTIANKANASKVKGSA